MTTSRRISMLFAGYVSAIILLFGLAINIVFFLSWYRIIDRSPMFLRSDVNKRGFELSGSELMSTNFSGPLSTGADFEKKPFFYDNPPQFQEVNFLERITRPMLRGQTPLIITDDIFVQRLSKHKGPFDLISYESQIYHYHLDQDRRAHLTPVDALMDSQLLLIYISIVCMIIFAGLSYFVALWLVNRGLKPLHQLTEHVKGVDNPENYQHLFVGPSHDELQQVSSAFSHAMQTIAKQNKRLKEFVSHASHELKTPLMSISSASDVLIKKGKLSPQLTMIKNTTQNMKTLIDRLMLASHEGNLNKENYDIIPIIKKITNQEQKLHTDGSISLQLDHPKQLLLPIDVLSFELIITNLISNAYKYAKANTNIVLKITTNEISISNTIDLKNSPNMEMIRDPFYRVDTFRTDELSHGLGLTIVRQTIDRLGRNISAKIDGNKIYFTITW